MFSCFPFLSPKSRINISLAGQCIAKYSLSIHCFPEVLRACPRPLLHGSNSCPIADLHGLSTVCSITFAEAAASPAGDEDAGGRGAQIPHLASQLWACIAWGSPETLSLPLPQGKGYSAEPCAVSQPQAKCLKQSPVSPWHMGSTGAAAQGAFRGSPSCGH